MKRLCFIVLITASCCGYSNLKAQDTLKVALRDAETQFLKNNLLLIAEQYQISGADALVIQARLWQNPYITAELNAYNPNNKQAFDIGQKGQKVFAIQQLIYLGGKKRNEIELAKQNTQLAMLSFQDLLRNLKYELRNNFYSVYFDRMTLQAYTQQLQLLKSIIDAYSEQSQKGNIPLKEVVRLQAVYYKLNNDKTDLLHNIIEEETILKQLLNVTGPVYPVISDTELNRFNIQILPPLDSLTSISLQNRPDYLAVVESKKFEVINLNLQRSLAVPDLTLGGGYDQRGGAFNNQIGITMGMSLPLLNRNQGNIRFAQEMVKASDIRIQQKSVEVTTEVQLVYAKLNAVDSDYNSIGKTFASDFIFLNEGVMANFKKRNINLLEFVDFVESYNESINEINRIKKNRLRLFEEINHVTASELFK